MTLKKMHEKYTPFKYFFLMIKVLQVLLGIQSGI